MMYGTLRRPFLAKNITTSPTISLVRFGMAKFCRRNEFLEVWNAVFLDEIEPMEIE